MVRLSRSPWWRSDRAVRSGFGPDARSGKAPNTSASSCLTTCLLPLLFGSGRPLAPAWLAFGTRLAARLGSRSEPFGADSGRMQGAAKRRILEVFQRAATHTGASRRALLDRSGRGRFGTLPGCQGQQTGENSPERRRGDFHHGLLGPSGRHRKQ
jgi:hypothetical protein